MSWDIVRIYTFPEKNVIDFFKTIPVVESIYLINDLEGVDDYSRENIFGDVPTKYSYMRHGLPDGGLLAVEPEVKTGFYGECVDEERIMEPITNDYGVINELTAIPELNTSHFNLFYYLKQLNDQTGVPILYFQDFMWGGPSGDDLAVVFDGDIIVYRGHGKIENGFQVVKNLDVEAQTTILQKGLEHVGLILPDEYFALHVREFDWGRYGIHSRWQSFNMLLKITFSFWNEKKSSEELLSIYRDSVSSTDLKVCLEMANRHKSSKMLEDSFFVGFLFGLFDAQVENILLKIILGDWHRRHEEIAHIFELIFNTNKANVPFLLAAINTIPVYLHQEDFKGSYIHQLINAIVVQPEPDNLEALKKLTQSEDEVIKRWALNKLEKKEPGKWEKDSE
ncbi:hypothetical protein A4H97_28245 [Niastella yeongjuensis]|uniref:Uncharacterized protein n=1 Tax=Niastella yeongjuensis TaxID=354355 RepID=A0A1V9EUE2_9BACT|nr:hypothetical protein [Niastella yeongjuensis]OQP49783.1 hypothetical protein A4H97_28245 [Niastella yeongjuensis]SEP40357.1 hypothetical protein SAMN05660816_05784 [Niastella yeongjuensis]